MRETSRSLATLGGGEVWRSTVEPQSELDEEIQKARMKDMPVEDMKNPFEREKAQCILCQYKIVPDYKNVKLLSQFVSPYTGQIYGRHITRLCAAQQARLEKEIFKSQSAGFMPYYFKDVAYVKDPKLFDPDRPIRPHRF
ncbi:28S ribosomal protein S18c, mitochondrial isoform X2 [Zootermopsis nevadensis]|nr:28S ribosomal protein S18c, mitochondrial isoform X2 [Zootermopsis nevadensis]XP_021938845.1 28S ribosomal protein S18c, mitochondrial isoform X2 [Zootermopsis nevadensis]